MRKPHLAALDPKPGEVLARCSFCRKLFFGPSTIHGMRCPKCETGHLTTQAMQTDRMIAEAEIEGIEDILHIVEESA